MHIYVLLPLPLPLPLLLLFPLPLWPLPLTLPLPLPLPLATSVSNFPLVSAPISFRGRPADCMSKFVSNKWLGALLFCGIVADKYVAVAF